MAEIHTEIATRIMFIPSRLCQVQTHTDDEEESCSSPEGAQLAIDGMREYFLDENGKYIDNQLDVFELLKMRMAIREEFQLEFEEGDLAPWIQDELTNLQTLCNGEEGGNLDRALKFCGDIHEFFYSRSVGPLALFSADSIPSRAHP